MKTILVTGAAGFIGYHLCEKLIQQGYNVVGLDNINGYYDINLKMGRLNELGIKTVYEHKVAKGDKHGDQFHFYKLNLEDQHQLPLLFKKYSFDSVCNLAAQAGVRYSIEEPMVYAESNMVGFLNLLECMRHHKVKKLVYASSSSVYGNSNKLPFSESDNVDAPVSLYAATKKANELMASTYSHLYGMETIGLRFFTVYGPWGRPDMAMFLFTEAIINNKPIKVFNEGLLSRDFTFIDDIIRGVLAIITADEIVPNRSEIFNIGNGQPVKLVHFIEAIETQLNKKAVKELLPMQPGDVYKTWANVEKLNAQYNYKPNTSIDKGVASFINWYKKYYKIE